MTTHAKELTDPFDTAYPLITSYFDVYSLSIAKYENEDILKIHFTAVHQQMNIQKERLIY